MKRTKIFDPDWFLVKMLIPLVLIPFLLLSCNDELSKEVKESTLLSVKFSIDEGNAFRIKMTGSSEISKEEAIQLLKSTFMSKSLTKAAIPIIITSCKKELLNNGVNTKSSDNLGYYVIEFSKGGQSGFSLVSSDLRLPEVFSYSEDGSLNDTVSNKGLKLFYNLLSSYIEKSINKFNTDSLYKCALNRFPSTKTGDWIDEGTTHTLIVPDVSYVSQDYQYMGSDSGSDEWTRTKTLSTRWGQGIPYNELLPKVGNGIDSGNERAWVGCEMIATAQIMAYYKKTYKNITPADWTRMTVVPEYSGIDLQNVMSDLFYAMKKGDPKPSGTSSDMGKAREFLSQHGYTVGGEKNFDFFLVRDALGKGPIIIRGDGSVGHAWVIDGVRTYTITTYDLYEKDDGYDIWRIKVEKSSFIYAYVQCNYGQYGDANGWYSGSVFKGVYHGGKSFDYSNNVKIINGIY